MRWNKITRRIPFLEDIIVMVWNKRIKIILIKIYVRLGKNEFHWMLNLDEYLITKTNKKEIINYWEWIIKQRKIIHERTL